MSHVVSGDRAYLVDSDSYGDVGRTKFLGITGIVLSDDNGNFSAFCGEKANTSVVNKTTGKNGKGTAISMPTDVKSEGVEVLASMNISPENQRLMFVKFMGMFSKEQRRAYMDEWITVKNDDAQKNIFLNALVQDLDDDEVFIQTEGKKALIGIDPDVQKKMFTKLLTVVDKTTREQYIIQWMIVKNDKNKKEEFLQGMYEQLMDDDDYILMEGRKSMSELKIPYTEQVRLFQKLLQSVSQDTRGELVGKWRKIRKSKSQRALFLKELIGLIETS